MVLMESIAGSRNGTVLLFLRRGAATKQRKLPYFVVAAATSGLGRLQPYFTTERQNHEDVV